MNLSIKRNIILNTAYVFIVILTMVLANAGGHPYVFGYIFKISIVLLFIVTVLINIKNITTFSNSLNYMIVLFFSAISAALIGYLSFVLAVNVFIAMGGKP